jgi:hypothetical protein
MTMLIHTRGPLERTPRSSVGRKTVRTGLAAARSATIKRFCVRALAVLAAMGALAGIIALEAAFYLSRLNY